MVSAQKRSLGDGAAAIGVAFGTFALLSAFKRWAPIHLDTARDMLIARDCNIGSQCWGAGPPSSFPGVVLGAIWVHMLQVRAALGVSIAGFQRIIDVLLAGAAGRVSVAGRAVL